jgi:hypothetical protein
MIILKRPKPSKFALKTTCTGKGNTGNGCGAILLVTREDLRFYPGVYGDSWGSRPPAVCFKCIVCSTITDVPQDDWPNGYTSLTPFTQDWYKSV